jgi:transposase
VYQVWKRYRQSGQRGSLKIGGYRRAKLQDSEELLRSWISAEPDLTLVEMCARLKTQGIAVSPSTLWYRLDRLGLTVKKNAARRRARAS